MDQHWLKRATLPELKRAGIENHIQIFSYLGTARAISEGVLVVTEDWCVKMSEEHSRDLDEILAEIERRPSARPDTPKVPMVEGA